MNENELYLLIGKRIKYLRKQKHFTQENLAEKSGLSLDYIGKIEANINHPGIKAILKIANALDIPIKELFDFEN